MYIPRLETMTDEEVHLWVNSLTTELVYQHLTPLTEAIIKRMGPTARVSTSTFQPPKIIHVIERPA